MNNKKFIGVSAILLILSILLLISFVLQNENKNRQTEYMIKGDTNYISYENDAPLYYPIYAANK